VNQPFRYIFLKERPHKAKHDNNSQEGEEEEEEEAEEAEEEETAKDL